jgi:GT2 family glycosyltransferase
MNESAAAPRTAVIIVAFEGEALLGDCLDALLADLDPGLEVLVVDNASRDASLEVARRREAARPGSVHTLALPRNFGFAGGVNRGVAALMARESAPEVLVLLNQDCVVSRGWLAPLVEALGDPAVAVAGARLLEADGVTLQHAGARLEANGLTTHVGRGCRDPSAHRERSEVDYVCGALVAMRSDTWVEFGPFDEGYTPAYYEEVDFCTRARRAGRRIVYVPGSEAVHLEAASSVAGSALFLRRYHRSRLRFVVRTLLGRGRTLRWMAAEALWLLRLRHWREIAPVLSAYVRVPGFFAERFVDWKAGRAA